MEPSLGRTRAQTRRMPSASLVSNAVLVSSTAVVGLVPADAGLIEPPGVVSGTTVASVPSVVPNGESASPALDGKSAPSPVVVAALQPGVVAGTSAPLAVLDGGESLPPGSEPHGVVADTITKAVPDGKSAPLVAVLVALSESPGVLVAGTIAAAVPTCKSATPATEHNDKSAPSAAVLAALGEPPGYVTGTIATEGRNVVLVPPSGVAPPSAAEVPHGVVAPYAGMMEGASLGLPLDKVSVICMILLIIFTSIYNEFTHLSYLMLHYTPHNTNQFSPKSTGKTSKVDDTVDYYAPMSVVGDAHNIRRGVITIIHPSDNLYIMTDTHFDYRIRLLGIYGRYKGSY
jgi:hypothetical protein